MGRDDEALVPVPSRDGSARELLDRAAALLDDVPETPESERLLIEIAIDRAAANATNRKEEDLEIIADARARAERLGDDRLLGLVYAREAGSHAMMELLRDAGHQQVVIDKALEIGHRLNDPEILALPSALNGIRLMREGHRREAIPVLAEAVDALEKYVVNEASFYAGQLGIAHADLGEFETAAPIRGPPPCRRCRVRVVPPRRVFGRRCLLAGVRIALPRAPSEPRAHGTGMGRTDGPDPRRKWLSSIASAPSRTCRPKRSCLPSPESSWRRASSHRLRRRPGCPRD